MAWKIWTYIKLLIIKSLCLICLYKRCYNQNLWGKRVHWEAVDIFLTNTWQFGHISDMVVVQWVVLMSVFFPQIILISENVEVDALMRLYQLKHGKLSLWHWDWFISNYCLHSCLYLPQGHCFHKNFVDLKYRWICYVLILSERPPLT